MTNAQTVAALEMALAVFSEQKKLLMETQAQLAETREKLEDVGSAFAAYVVAMTAQQAEVQRIAEELNALCAESVKEVRL